MIEIDYIVITERLLLAAVLGGLIGWERERRNKQAGVKTHLLVTVGATLIMMTSIYGFGDISEIINHPNARFDPARIAAQVVSGIGFLGAGAILRHSNMFVTGLTTAATLWVSAAIGLSVGTGFYFPAIAVTLIALLSVVILREVEVKFGYTKKIRELVIVMGEETNILKEVSKRLESERIEIRKVAFSEKEDDGERDTVVTLRIRLPTKKNLLKVAEQLQRINGVKEVHYDRTQIK